MNDREAGEALVAAVSRSSPKGRRRSPGAPGSTASSRSPNRSCGITIRATVDPRPRMARRGLLPGPPPRACRRGPDRPRPRHARRRRRATHSFSRATAATRWNSIGRRATDQRSASRLVPKWSQPDASSGTPSRRSSTPSPSSQRPTTVNSPARDRPAPARPAARSPRRSVQNGSSADLVEPRREREALDVDDEPAAGPLGDARRVGGDPVGEIHQRVRGRGEPRGRVEPERRAAVRGDELVESVQPVLEHVQPRGRAAERARDDEHVAGLRAAPAGDPLATAERRHGDVTAARRSCRRRRRERRARSAPRRARRTSSSSVSAGRASETSSASGRAPIAARSERLTAAAL